MQIGVVGINHKMANLFLREKLAKICHLHFSAGQSAQAFVLLSTCNRTEVYFSSIDLAATHSYILNRLRLDLDPSDEEFDQKLYSYFGYDCFQHLARVTTGLDSAIAAETEIQGQVKSAYEEQMAFSQLPKELHYLFQKCLKIGKHVRSTLAMGRGMPDIEHAIHNTFSHHFANRPDASILFVGASDINRKVLTFLRQRGLKNITLCNRTEEHAVTCAKVHHIDVIDWNLFAQWHRYDCVILGTKASEHLISKDNLPLVDFGDKLIFDLSVPRNVQPALARDQRITLLNIDQLNRMLKFRRKQMAHILTEAEEQVGRSAERQVTLFKEKEQARYRMLATSA